MTLKINRIDSPLARTPDPPPTPRPEPQQPIEAPQPSKKPPRAPARARRQPTLATVPAPEAADDLETRNAPADPWLAGVADPPPLGESLELLSTRLPTSLRRSVSDMTVALRTRHGGRASQKSLPEQEILAVLIWLAGSPHDPEAVERLGRAVDAYRAQRYAAAARALGA